MYTSLKLWFMTKSLIMIMISILSFIVLILSPEKIIFHFDMNSFIEIPFSMTLIIDSLSLIFISTVSMVSSMIILYSFYYLQSETLYSQKKFILILLTFILSMFILSFSGNLFWLMVGWDGLGISSFCLIIFYQNWKSLSSGMVTFLTNRLGDTLIIISILWVIIGQSADACVFPKTILLLSFCTCLGAYSKSAQLPYLFWLPQAMAAPTPVSALVHSSTLVTAGIYLMCRFQPSMSNISILFIIVSCITIFMAGTSSLMEFDLKKVIALSTLCHVSMMMMFSMMGEVNLSLLHLMMHAFFKSLLFMIAGLMIHSNDNCQDIRFIHISKKEIGIIFPFLISIFSMMGLPFLSGFYSKEVLFASSSFHMSYLIVPISFLVNSFFSCAYSVRLLVYLFSGMSKKTTLLNEKKSESLILILGCIFSSFFGGIFVTFFLPEENFVQPLGAKALLLFSLVIGIFSGIKASTNFRSWILYFLSEFWKSNYIYKIFQKHFFSLSNLIMWSMDEKGISKVMNNNIFIKNKNLSHFFGEIFLKEPFAMVKSFHFFVIMTFMFLM